MTTQLRCPDCGSLLDIVLDGLVGVPYADNVTHAIEYRMTPRPFAACTGCDFCLDLLEAVRQQHATLVLDSRCARAHNKTISRRKR